MGEGRKVLSSLKHGLLQHQKETAVLLCNCEHHWHARFHFQIEFVQLTLVGKTKDTLWIFLLFPPPPVTSVSLCYLVEQGRFRIFSLSDVAEETLLCSHSHLQGSLWSSMWQWHSLSCCEENRNNPNPSCKRNAPCRAERNCSIYTSTFLTSLELEQIKNLNHQTALWIYRPAN